MTRRQRALARAAVGVATGHAYCWRCARTIGPAEPWTIDTGAAAHIACHPNARTRKFLAGRQKKHRQSQSRLTW